MEHDVRRIPSLILLSVLFLASLCHSQSLADAARKNRAQKEANSAKAAKVIETDDISTTPDATYAPVAGQTPGQWTRQIQAQKMWVQHFQAEVDKSSAKMEL